MRILLLNPPQDLDAILGVGKNFVQKYEPLGLLYIAAVLREQQYDVTVLDAYGADYDISSVKKYIKENSFDVIGVSTLTCNGAIVYDLGKWIKSNIPDTPVVLGNVHAAIYAKYYLRDGACDYVIHGEGDYIFSEVLAVIAGKKQTSELKCVSYLLPEGEVFVSKDTAFVEDIDTLPLPARDLVDSSHYSLNEISNQMFVGSEKTVCKTMFTSRGCPNRCSFCVVHSNRKPRLARFDLVVDEMEMLKKQYGADYVFFMDSLFFADRDRVLKICDEINKRGLEIKWGCDAHVRFIDEEVVRAIEKAGCYELSFGIESGVQKLLNNVRKGITLKQVEDAISVVKKHSSIKVGGLFILGLPGETYADSVQTIKFAKKLPLDIAQFSILVPYPGSPLFEELRKNNDLDDGIDSSDNLHTDIWQRYSSYISFTDKDPIWVTSDLTHKKLKKLQKKAQREFYLRPKMIMHNLKRVRPGNIFKIIKIFLKAFF